MKLVREVHINDVIDAFRLAKSSAGMKPAMDVVRRFGAEYVGTIPSGYWWQTILAFNALAHSDDPATANPAAPASERARAGSKKPIAAE